jgi:hypothetical protein
MTPGPVEMGELARAGAAGALRELTALAGGASLCAIGRSGESFPAVKYHEGRMTAFGEATRVLDRGGDRADIEAVRETWVRLRRDAPAGDWAAYRAGGVDALSELLSEAGAA